MSDPHQDRYMLTARHGSKWRWKTIWASSDAMALEKASEEIAKGVALADPGGARIWIDGTIILTNSDDRIVRQMPLANPQLSAIPTSVFAKRIGRSQTYVKEHAEELGGVKAQNGVWAFFLPDDWRPEPRAF